MLGPAYPPANEKVAADILPHTEGGRMPPRPAFRGSQPEKGYSDTCLRATPHPAGLEAAAHWRAGCPTPPGYLFPQHAQGRAHSCVGERCGEIN